MLGGTEQIVVKDTLLIICRLESASSESVDRTYASDGVVNRRSINTVNIQHVPTELRGPETHGRIISKMKVC